MFAIIPDRVTNLDSLYISFFSLSAVVGDARVLPYQPVGRYGVFKTAHRHIVSKKDRFQKASDQFQLGCFPAAIDKKCIRTSFEEETKPLVFDSSKDGWIQLPGRLSILFFFMEL